MYTRLDKLQCYLFKNHDLEVQFNVCNQQCINLYIGLRQFKTGIKIFLFWLYNIIVINIFISKAQ